MKAKVEGDWNQIQSKGAKCFLFEPNRETLQRFELDAESSLLDPSETIVLRVHNYSYSATFIGKEMAIGTIEPCEVVSTELSPKLTQENGLKQTENFQVVGQTNVATDSSLLLAKLQINPELPKEVQKQVRDHLVRSTDIFALDDTQLGVTDWAEHSIDTGEAKPVKQHPWRTPIR